MLLILDQIFRFYKKFDSDSIPLLTPIVAETGRRPLYLEGGLVPPVVKLAVPDSRTSDAPASPRAAGAGRPKCPTTRMPQLGLTAGKDALLEQRWIDRRAERSAAQARFNY